MSGLVEEPTEIEAPLSGVADTAALRSPLSGAGAPGALLTRTVGEDGSVHWRVARPRRRWRVMTVAAVAAAALGVGYFALARDERAVNTASRARQVPSAPARPVTARQVVTPVQPIDTAPSAGADRAPAVEAPPPASASETGRYAVQIAAVPTDREAEQLLGWLAKEGYSAYLEPTTTERGRLLRVRVGPLASLEAAQDVAAQLGEAGYAGHWITGGDAPRTPR